MSLADEASALRWWQPVRTVDGIDVALVDLAAGEAEMTAATALLDPAERARAARYVVERPRRQFTLTRAALRLLLAERLGTAPDRIDFALGPHGKPRAVVAGRPAPISFNVSHSGPHGLIAIAPPGRADVDLGIDIEVREADRAFHGIARKVFGARERATLAALSEADVQTLFYRLWTIKEALIKAVGAGFSLDPSTFEAPECYLADLDRTDLRAPFAFPDAPDRRFVLEDLSTDDFAAAIAHDLA